MLKTNFTFIFILGVSMLAQAQFSSSSKTSWIYRTGEIALGTSSKYTSYGTPKLHIDKGFLRIGRSAGSTDRGVNFLRFGDGDYLRIGEWHRDDMLSLKATQGFNFSYTQSTPYFNDIFFYIYGQSNDIGLAVRSQHTSDWKYGFISAVNRNNSKVLAVINTSLGSGDGQDVFRVYGNGHVECKRVKVATNIWADYVFSKDYKLSNLSEIEEYISKNGHLPGIPTEKEAVEQGIDLGEMNRLLLEKVEELTLHLIEQEKKIEQLNKKSKKSKK